jgi:hypothetical protein
MRPETSAWLILLSFFALFCIIVASSSALGWRYYRTATVPINGTLLRSHVNAGVVIQARGELNPSSVERLPPSRDPCPNNADICAELRPGDTVKTRREAGYGPVASVILPDETHIQLGASPNEAEVTLEHFLVSKWNDERQEVLLAQHAGYARYDIAEGQRYQSVEYSVDVGNDTSVRLTPGGSYSISVATGDEARVRMAWDRRPLQAEVAVRKGTAIVQHDYQRALVSPGEKVQLSSSGALSQIQVASWELLAAGGFEDFKQEHLYLADSHTWQRYWVPNVPAMPRAEQNGDFTVVQSCPPAKPDLCTPDEQVPIGQFRRDGNQTRPHTAGIEQTLDVDVSEYTSIHFTGWVRVLNQSVPDAGAQGSECPVMIWFKYKPTSPTDQEQSRFFCIYSVVDTSSPALPDLEAIRYRQVPRFQWYRLDIELRDDSLIRQARYLQTLRVEARGHDYLSEITGLSLVGTQ